MSQDLKMLAEVRERQAKVLQGAKDLQAAMDSFREEIGREVQLVLEKTSYTLKRPVAVDDGSPPPLELPSPLLPVASSSPNVESASNNPSASALSALDDVPYTGFSAQSSSIPSISCSNVMDSPQDDSLI